MAAPLRYVQLPVALYSQRANHASSPSNTARLVHRLLRLVYVQWLQGRASVSGDLDVKGPGNPTYPHDATKYYSQVA